jgi:predicted TPR repeat methyltransferase
MSGSDAGIPAIEIRLRESIAQAAAGNLAAAEDSGRALVLDHPTFAPAQIHLARVLLARGKSSDAIDHLNAFLGTPSCSEMYRLEATFLRALSLQSAGRHEAALAELEKTVRADPRHVHAWVNKGLVEKQMCRFREAVESFTRALSLNPAIAPVHYSLGLIHILKGRRAEAESSFRKALEFDPRHIHAASQLAKLLQHDDRPQQAAEIYRTILENDPGNATARFHLDVLQDKDGPVRVPADVVRAIYANESVGRSLEGSLRGHLRYRTPAILETALGDLYGAKRPVLDVLDLGCGSGLYGALLKARARRLVGVDLSAAMIAECRRKGVYGDLHIGDIVHFLADVKDNFDLIVAMDVFCYFGDLRPVFSACAAVLEPGGVLACSVERASDGSAWTFHRSSHFLHSGAHLREAAAVAGMREYRVTECALRRELGEDRMGFVALFTR